MTDPLQTTLRQLHGRVRRPVVTIGNFDGVHRGHRAIIHGVVERANQLQTDSVAVTFEPHPVSWFRKLPVDTFRLTSPERKLQLLAALGVAHPIALPFGDELAAFSPEDFVARIIADVLDAAEVWIGYDFNFGRGRAGTPADLQRLAVERGIVVKILDPVLHDGDVVSSTRIRKALHAGDLQRAASLLGRPHAVEGRVEHGHARGRRLGFPTANIQPTAGMMVPHGVYVTTLHTDGQTLPAVTNIGLRPTFGEQTAPNVESFILDGLPPDADLYGATIQVELQAFLRPEQRFEDIEALKARIAEDIRAARAHHGLDL